MKTWPARLFAVLLAAAASVLAQTAPATGAGDTTPKFTARSELVVVPVLVLRHGEHVAGLHANAFLVEDDGVRKPIASFEEMGASGESPIAVMTSSDKDGGTAISAGPSSVVLVFDLVNTSMQSQEYGKRKLLEFLRRDFPADRPTMLAVMSRAGLRILQDFTTDRATLASLVQQIGTEKRPDALDNAKQAEGRSLRYELDPADSFDTVQHQLNQEMKGRRAERDRLSDDAAISGMRQLFQLGSILRQVPGVKSVIWASAGFRLPDALSRDPHGTGQLYQRMLQQFGAARASVYSVDVREDTPNPVYAAPENMLAPPPGVGMRYGIVGPVQTFEDISEKTGGAYCVLHKDPGACFRRAVDYGARYYVLTFYASASERLQWHKLHVGVKEDGVQVRSRTGYFAAGPAPAPAAETQRSNPQK